eukprot:PITA_05569
MDSIRLTLAIVAAQGWEVHQMDVKDVFLHRDLSKEIYMEQPHGFIQDSSLVFRLKKSLYGLKQAPRAWLRRWILFFYHKTLKDGTITFGIHYATGTALNLLGFTDSDWARDSIDRKSTSGYSLSLGSVPICWSSKKQAAIALSSAEAEYKGVVNITIQALWLQCFLTELGVQFHQPIVIWCDNQSTLKFCRDRVQRQRTKHIEIHMHYIRDLVHDRVIDL